jgi:hypothetical protein
MTPQGLMLILAASLIGLGLGAAFARRHRLASVIGGQLGGLGALVAILALVGPAGEWFAALAVGLTVLHGLLVTALQEAGGDEILADDDGDPLKW